MSDGSPQSASTLLCVEGLSKRFSARDAPVVRDLTFDVKPGEIFVIIGPSGCGKTTTLRIIAGFEDADAGSVRLADRQIVGGRKRVLPERRGIGFVFQDYALFPHLSVLKNVMYGLRELPRRSRRERAVESLRAVGMEDLAARRPHQLSGGQQQRVALARSIAPSPELILLDEPFSNLDPAMRAGTRSEIRRLIHQRDMTAVFVTHDQEEALSFADRIAVMDHGVLAQVGRPHEVYNRPRTKFVAQFLGRTNLLEVDATGREAKSALGVLELEEPAHGRVTVSLRPEHLDLSPAIAADGAGGGSAGAAPRGGGRVVDVEFKGHDLTYTVEHQGKTYTVQTDHRCVIAPGQAVTLRPRQAAVVVED